MGARWRLLQLADSGFPAGGFAHSGGLEAARALGEVRGAEAVIGLAASAIWQAATFALPYAGAAHAVPADGPALDARCEAATAGHVSRRASRAQGKAWLRTCVDSFGIAPVALPHGHFPVVFGVTTAALGLDRDDALALYLQLVARGMLSAAVRLGALGPVAAQRAQDGLATVADDALAACRERTPADAGNSAPVLELFANLHDALPARLFQS